MRYILIFVLFLEIILGNTDALAKDYQLKDVAFDSTTKTFYDKAKKTITGRVISVKDEKKTIVTVKDGKQDGETLTYIKGILRAKNILVNGQLREINTYWTNGKIRTHTPIMARYVNGSLAEKYTNEPTKWYYKNGKLMLALEGEGMPPKFMAFYDKKGQLLAKINVKVMNNSFCVDNGKKVPLRSTDIFLNEYNRILDDDYDDKEMDFSKFKCSQ